MTTETINVHVALCEAKTMDKRIEKLMAVLDPVAAKEHKVEKVQGVSIEDFTKEANSGNDKVTHMIDRYMAIKAAINQYNASTHITVGNKQYTIAQAIWMMQYGIKQKIKLRDKYTKALTTVQSKISIANGDKLNERAEQAALINFGSKEKANTEEYLKCIQEYKERNMLELVDPLKISKLIEKLDDEISDFQVNVDAAIQMANATHNIVIEY